MIEYSPIPVITETSIGAVAKNWYTFRVSKLLNKDQIRNLIENKFKVNVVSIKTMVVKGKVKRSSKSRKVLKKSDWKKAIVKIKEGQKIESFDLGGAQ